MGKGKMGFQHFGSKDERVGSDWEITEEKSYPLIGEKNEEIKT